MPLLSGQGARRVYRVLAPCIIAGLAISVIAVLPRHQSKATVPAAAIVHSRPMQGCLALMSGAVGANFYIPSGMTEDGSGDLIVADSYNNIIRKIAGSGSVSTIAGNGDALLVNGAAVTASFRQPVGVAVGFHGEIFVADAANHVIRKINAGVVTTFAGSGEIGALDGDAGRARFDYPAGIAIDRHGNLVVSDSGNHTVRRVSPSAVVSTMAGSGQPGFVDGTVTTARFNSPRGVALDAADFVYIADFENNAIRKISPLGEVTTFAGSGEVGKADGTGKAATFNHPIDLTLDDQGNVLVLDQRNQLIRKISAGGVVTSFASAPPGRSRFEFPYGIATDKAHNIYVSYNSGIVRKVSAAGEVLVVGSPGPSGSVDGPSGVSRLAEPSGLAADRNGNIYVADAGNNVVRKISSDGRTVVFAGSGKVGDADGSGSEATFSRPTALAIDARGSLYVGGDHLVRKVAPDGAVTTVAGQAQLNQAGGNPTADGPGLEAGFGVVGGLAVDKYGNVYVADFGVDRIRKISPDGNVTTVAGGQRFSLFGTFGYDDGNARSATFHSPMGIAVDDSGNIFVADTVNNAIRKVSREGVVSTLAGGKAAYAAIREKGPINGLDAGGYSDGQGSDAQFNDPIALAVDGQGNLFVADAGNRAIRRVSPEGNVSTVLGNSRGFETVLGGPPTDIGRPSGIALLPDGQLAISVPEAVVRTVRKAQCTAANGGRP